MPSRSAILCAFLCLCLAGAGEAADRLPPGAGHLAVPDAGKDRAGDAAGEESWLAGFFRGLFSGPDGGADEAEAKPGFGETGKTRFFDLIGWLLGETGEAAPAQGLEVRAYGSPRLEKRRGEKGNAAARGSGMHAYLFEQPPPWISGARAAASGSAPALRRRAARKGREVEFDLYLWFLTELPKRRVEAYVNRANEEAAAQSAKPIPGR